METSKTLFRELMGHAASAGSLDAVYRAALQCVEDGLGIDRASLLLFDESGKMRFVAWSGLSDEYRRAVDGHSPWSPDENNAAPELVADVEDCAAIAPLLAVLRSEQVRALAFIPLQFGATLLEDGGYGVPGFALYLDHGLPLPAELAGLPEVDLETLDVLRISLRENRTR